MNRGKELLIILRKKVERLKGVSTVSNRYKVGDKVYFTKRFQDIFWWNFYKTPPEKPKHPIEKKIIQVVNTKNGTLYGVKGGHFSESWIDDIVFNSKEAAQAAIDNSPPVCYSRHPLENF